MNAVLSNVFAQRLLLSLRRVDDPGTREVISTLVFKVGPNNARESTDSGLSEGVVSSEEVSGNVEVLERSDLEAQEKNVPNEGA